MKFSKEVKVGLLTTVTFTIIYIGFNYLKGKEIYPSSHIYYAIYKDARGLTTANEVTLNGFQVGRVQQVEILPEQAYQVRVTLAINKEIKLTNNTVARLEGSSLLGHKTIALIIKGGEPLENKGTLLSEMEQDLTTKFAESTLPALDDARTLALLTNKFMQNLIENTSRINTIFSNLEKTSDQLRKTITMNQQDLTSISRDIAAVASSLSNEETGVKPLLFKANQLLHEAEKLEIRETIVKLNNILTKLESGPLYKHINQTIVDLDKLIVDLRTYPSRYVNFSIFGRNSTLGKRYKKTNELPSTPPSSQPTTPSTSMKNKANNKKK
jgi:phospholipid/cholesterol/gamma-HCH transport system substrate-binding protein